MKRYSVRAAKPTASYAAGTYWAASAAEAIRLAQQAYRRSPVGSELHEVAIFTWSAQEVTE